MPPPTDPNRPEPRTEPNAEQVLTMIERANGLARRAMDAGHHPFGALLVGPDHSTVLMEQGNVDSVNHAESVLARDAARRYSPAQLWPCTLVSTVEPCAMCAATQYWANIGRVVFGIEERVLLRETAAPATPAAPTLDLPCRHVFARGQKDIRVIGPIAVLATPIVALHKRYMRAR